MKVLALLLALGADLIEMRIGVGMQKVVTVPAMKRFSVIPPSGVLVVKRVSENTLLLVGDGLGTATLRVRTKSGEDVFYSVTVQSETL